MAAFPQRLEAAVDYAAVYGTSGTRALPVRAGIGSLSAASKADSQKRPNRSGKPLRHRKSIATQILSAAC